LNSLPPIRQHDREAQARLAHHAIWIAQHLTYQVGCEDLGNALSTLHLDAVRRRQAT
jgi:hypothetical protein